MNEIEEIKNRLNIVDYVGKVVQLKKSGVNLSGLCPFHSEKTPSFIVSPEKQIFHCFGCNEGGDVIEFLIKTEGLTFSEALKRLASDAGVKLSSYSPSDKGEQKRERLFEINEIACAYFEQKLSSEEGRPALEYLKNRGLKEKTIKDFRLGFAPLSQSELLKNLRGMGFSEEELVLAGVAVKKPDLRGKFINRITFPILNPGGRVVGFSARVLDDRAKGGPQKSVDFWGKAPKYMNTPATDIYDKSSVLYGFYQAKGAIKKQDHAIIVEGNMDVIASSQAGVKNVVASSGTALTERQLDLLKRFTSNIKLAFDIDPAGDAATKRAIALAFEKGLNLKVIEIKGGKDAADAVMEDKNIWIEACRNAKYVVDYLFEKIFTNVKSSDILAKKKATKEFLTFIRGLSDPIERKHYLKILARKVDVSEQVLENLLEKRGSVVEKNTEEKTSLASAREKTEERLICLMFILPADASYAFGILEEEDFLDPFYQMVYRKAKVQYNNSKLDLKKIYAKLDPSEGKNLDILILKTQNETSEMSDEEKTEELFFLTGKIKKESNSRQIEALSLKLKQAEKSGDSKEAEDIINKIQKLIKQ